jgi:hypothetical protein
VIVCSRFVPLVRARNVRPQVCVCVCVCLGLGFPRGRVCVACAMRVCKGHKDGLTGKHIGLQNTLPRARDPRNKPGTNREQTGNKPLSSNDCSQYCDRRSRFRDWTFPLGVVFSEFDWILAIRPLARHVALRGTPYRSKQATLTSQGRLEPIAAASCSTVFPPHQGSP